MTDRHRISLLFQLFRTSELNSQFVQRALAPTGVRGDDYAVYSYLLQQPMTLTELADGTGLPLTTAAGYVQRFVERGHVEKVPNPDDGRSKLLRLTPGTREWILEIATAFTPPVQRLHALLQERGIDVEGLYSALTDVQETLQEAITELDATERAAA